MAPSRCAAHERTYPCSSCTHALTALLHKNAPGTRLWACDLDALTAVLTKGLPDLTACVHCGRGSTAFEDVQRCSCKGGKTTPLHLAELRCDQGAAWQGEDVTGADGVRRRGDDMSWQRGGNPFGASKESLMALNLIKAKTMA